MPQRPAVITDLLRGSDPDPAQDWATRIDLHFPETGGLNCAGAWHYRQVLKSIRCHKATKGIQQVHAARVLPEGWIAWLWRMRGGPRYWCFAHGEEINLEGIAHGGVMSSGQHRRMAQLVFRGCEGVIANSQNTARMLREQWHLPERKVHVAHPGVDASYFLPPSDAAAIRQKLGWQDRQVILTVGRLQRRKGQHLMLQALPQIISRFPHVLYVIVGDGGEFDALKTQAAELGIEKHVQWVGGLGDAGLRDVYQGCDVFVLPNCQIGSDVEGFGMVLLEAAACGKPTITGNTGGTKEAVVNGRRGWLSTQKIVSN